MGAFKNQGRDDEPLMLLSSRWREDAFYLCLKTTTDLEMMLKQAVFGEAMRIHHGTEQHSYTIRVITH